MMMPGFSAETSLYRSTVTEEFPFLVRNLSPYLDR